MILIDQQGRLLRRWNVIDVVVGLLVIGLLWSAYAAIQIASGRWQRRSLLMKQPVQVELQVIFVGLDDAAARAIRIGDVEEDRSGREVARILGVSPPQRETLVVRFGDRDWTKQIPNAAFTRWEVPARLRVQAELRGDVLYYKGRYIGSGSRVEFQTSRYTLRGFVYDEGWVRILMRTEPLPYEQARRITSDSRQVDDEGKVVARFGGLEEVSTIMTYGTTAPPAIRDESTFRFPPPSYAPPSTTVVAPLTPVTSSVSAPSASIPGNAPRRWRDRKKKESRPPDLPSSAVASWPPQPHVTPPQPPTKYRLLMWVDLRCTYYAGKLIFQSSLVEADQPLPMALNDVSFTGKVEVINPFRSALLTIEAAP